MAGDFQIDTRQFEKAILEYQKATKKEIPEILNRAGRDVAFRAAGKTPKASQAVIRADLLRDPHLVYALTSLKLKREGKGILPSPKFSEEVNKFIALRKSSSGFLRSGWATAIEKLGGHYRGMRTKKVHGWAKKASIVRFVTEIANTVPGIGKVGEKALAEAVNSVSRDKLSWARKRLAKIAQQHSAR